MATTVSTRGHEVENRVSNRFDFDTHGALSGRYVGSALTFSIGQLPDEWVKVMTYGAPRYVVFSYQTPIAWWDEVAGWYLPDVKYSVTTSRHQGVVRRALSRYSVTTDA